MQGKTLSFLIYEFRVNYGLSTRDFAKKAKLSAEAVRRIGNAEIVNPQAKTMKKLSACLGVPVAELWTALRREVS